LNDFLRDVTQSIVNLPVARMKQVHHKLESRTLEGNWKQHAWNYMDNFHIRFVHKGPDGLAGAVNLHTYHTELYKWSALQWVYAQEPEDGFEPDQLPTRFIDREHVDRRVFALWWFIFPNLTLNFYPWGLSINIYSPSIEDPGKTRFQWYHCVMDEDKYERKDEVWLDEQVDNEDVEAIANVNRGVQSGFAPRGRFSPTEEIGPHWLHRLIYENVAKQFQT
ncbi:MAG TPA: SRPBCC family protein, partial [Candidatus Binatus sp.]|nr:SRPBCC family protein [Candidatus Binatus sp.]